MTQLNSPHMAFAEALTDAVRSMDRTRRRMEQLLEALNGLPNHSEEANTKLRGHIVQLQQINNSVRNMGELK